MGLFNNKEKQDQKVKVVMEKYGLGSLSPEYFEAVKKINQELAGTGLMEAGLLLSGKSEDNVKIAYLNTLIAQNWIIIRQLDEISKKMK